MLWTKTVPPQAVGDGSGDSEPGQVGQQEQGGQLVDGVPDQRRGHHQPVEQQQVQQGLGRGQGGQAGWPETRGPDLCSTLDPLSQVPGALCTPLELTVCPPDLPAPD